MPGDYTEQALHYNATDVTVPICSVVVRTDSVCTFLRGEYTYTVGLVNAISVC